MICAIITRSMIYNCWSFREDTLSRRMALRTDIMIGILRKSLYYLIIITALCAFILIKRHIRLLRQKL